MKRHRRAYWEWMSAALLPRLKFVDEAGVHLSFTRLYGRADTSGAGDAFCAALAAGLVRGAGIRASAEWACKVAALSVSRPGTIPSYPTAKEVEAM